jgi:hypothetical protein
MPSRQRRPRPRAATQTSLFQDRPANELMVLPTSSVTAVTTLLARLLRSYHHRRAADGADGEADHG